MALAHRRHDWPKDAHGMPIRAIITQGTRADCKEVGRLIEGLSANCLLADKGYDANARALKVLLL